MDAIKMLKDDHRKVKALFKQYEAAKHSADRKQKIAEKVCDELEIHTKLEENDYYPAVEATGEKGTESIHEAEQEHEVIANLISKLRGMSPESEDYDATFKVLTEIVEHHVEEEESEMFPYSERVLGSGDLDHIGHKMAERKKSLSAPGILSSTFEQAKKLVTQAVEAVSGTGSETVSGHESNERSTRKQQARKATRTRRAGSVKKTAAKAAKPASKTRGAMSKRTTRSSGGAATAPARAAKRSTGRAGKVRTKAHPKPKATRPRKAGRRA